MSKRSTFSTFILITVFCISSLAQGELPDIGIQKNLAVGIVKSVGQEKLVLETKDGMLDVILLSVTAYKRLPPDNLSLKAAKEAALADIGKGDRVLVTGKVSADKKSVLTKTVYVVKSSDLLAKQRKERQEWIRRGIFGRVKTISAAANAITVEMRSMSGEATSIEVTPKPKIKYLRYASNSVKFKDAVASKFEEIEAGDMLRALGDKSEDQKSFKAEQILTGAFLTVAGKVKAIDAEKNEVTITDIKSKKDLVIAVNSDSLMKKFPEQIAQRMARMIMMRRMAGGAQPPRGGAGNGREATTDSSKQAKSESDKKQAKSETDNKTSAGQNREGGSAAAGRRGGRRGGMDINQMLNRFPDIKVADLKVGDMIAASSPKGKDPGRLTAIKLLAGVEPFLTLPQIPSGRAGGRGRGGMGGGLTIPGLDSLDF